MALKIPFDSLPAPAQDFVRSRAVGAVFALTETGDGFRFAGMVDREARPIEPVPPAVASALARAAIIAGMADLYELQGPPPAIKEPSRSDFPDTVDGGSRYMRALGAFHAANRAAFDGNDGRKGIADLMPGAKTMPRADFEKLDPADRATAMRARTRLTD